MTEPTVNSRSEERPAKAYRREHLRFESLDDLLADLDRLDANGGPRSTGNWSPGQNAQHVAKLIHLSIDGFGNMKAPLLLRPILRLLRGPIKRRVMRGPMQPGLKLPRAFAAFLPDDNISWERGRDELRAAVERLAHEEAVATSPTLGPLTHDQWVVLHLRHAEMHMSFLHPR